PLLALNGTERVVRRGLLLGVERTSLSRGPTSENDPGCVKTRLRIPKLLSTNSDWHQRGDFRVFLLFCVSRQPPCTAVQRGTAVGVVIESTARASRPHGCQQWLDADDVQHTREIVAEYVQRHFGRDIGQPLHQKV